MNSFLDYDPELPAGFQDADLLQASFEQEARHSARLHARGICTHGSGLGLGNVNRSRAQIDAERASGRFPERETDARISCQNDIPAGHVLCMDCGQIIRDRFAGI